MTREEVRMYLDLPYEDVVSFVKAGVLQADYRVTGESVRRFNENYVTSSTVARRLNIRVTRVERIMDGHGVQPAHSVGPPGRSTAFAWHRTDVMPIIERSVLARRHREDVGSNTKRPFDRLTAGGDDIPSDRRLSEASKPRGAALNG